MPSNSLAEARKSAIDDVIRQIMAAMGMEYSHHYHNRISGSVRNPRQVIDDKLSGHSYGFIQNVQASAVESNWLIDATSKYVFFILVYYPTEQIQEMHRLSKGANVIVSFISKDEQGVRLKISEVNGVSAIISSAELRIRQTNRFARAIALFFWKVSPMVEHSQSISIAPIQLCQNSAVVQLLIGTTRKKLIEYLIGAKFEYILAIKGHDEIGRPVAAKINF